MNSETHTRHFIKANNMYLCVCVYVYVCVCVCVCGPRLGMANVWALVDGLQQCVPRVNPLPGFHGNSGTLARGGQREPDTHNNAKKLSSHNQASLFTRSFVSSFSSTNCRSACSSTTVVYSLFLFLPV